MRHFLLRRALHSLGAFAVIVACLPALAAGTAAGTADKPAPKIPKVAAAATAPAAFSYSIEPAPSWVVPAVEKPDAPAMKAPLHYRVIDEQIRLDGKAVVNYSHVVRVVGDSSGLGQASQIELEFDPSFQSLALHQLDIVRDGKRLTRLDRKKIQLLQRETQLERRMYDGRATASVVLDDVRTGDQIDFAYSIRGQNPVFDDRFVNFQWMTSFRGPVALYQVRLLAPQARKIQYRSGMPDVQVSAKVDRGLRETIFRRESVAQFSANTNAPYGSYLKQQLQFSEYDDWAEVARWGQGLFAPAGGDGAAIDKQAAEINAMSNEPEQQLLAALRFVQADVRYFGTEIGPNSHRPAAPEKVLEQRFGDCKDKVALLVALLRRLDIAATPVLVSTRMRGRIDEMLPSPLAFDHVIARVELKGQAYFLDATRSHQTGELKNRQATGFDKGLPLSTQTSALLALPSDIDQQRMRVQDSFRVTRFAEPVALESRITYRGDLAELMREALATRSIAELQAQLSAPYARAYPKLANAAPMTVVRSETDDAVTLVQSFTIPDYWRFPEQRSLTGDLLQWSIVDALRVPNEPSRNDPFAISYPGIYRHESSVEYAEDVNGMPASNKLDDGDRRFRLRNTSETSARRSEYVTELQLLVDQVEAGDWSAHVAQVNKLGPRAGVTVSVPALSLAGLEQLRRELKDTDDAVRAQKLRPRTRMQYEAFVKSQVLSAQVASGRLAPNLEAQALTARGIQYDHLGRYADATKDFARALALAPDATETANAAAVNALQSQDFANAIALTDRLLAKNAGDAEARNTRALARYFSKDYPAAKADVDELLKDRSQVRRGYPVVWLALISRNGGADAAAATGAAADIPEEQLPADWPRPLVDWARGKTSADAVITAAKAGSAAPERLCEAYFYIAERHLAEGDTARAKEFFRKSVDQGVTEFIEHGSSQIRLASLPR